GSGNVGCVAVPPIEPSPGHGDGPVGVEDSENFVLVAGISRDAELKGRRVRSSASIRRSARYWCLQNVLHGSRRSNTPCRGSPDGRVKEIEECARDSRGTRSLVT